jgi:hypothetical protein
VLGEAFRLVSVNTSEPLRLPGTVGAKVTGKVQLAPAARVADALLLLYVNGQLPPLLLSKVKFVAMLGLFPLLRIGKVSVALPLLIIVSVCGLSLLIEPTAVDAKVRLGALA